jgi:hypothetical protein
MEKEKNLDIFALPVSTPPFSTLRPALAVLLHLILIVLLFVVNYRDILLPLDINGNLSNDYRTAHIAVVTILASFISAYTVGQIKSVWVHNIIAKLDPDDHSPAIHKQCGTVVGLAAIKDQVQCFYISLPLLIAGFITAALVTGFTPTYIPGKWACPIPSNLISGSVVSRAKPV